MLRGYGMFYIRKSYNTARRIEWKNCIWPRFGSYNGGLYWHGFLSMFTAASLLRGWTSTLQGADSDSPFHGCTRPR